MRFDSSAYGKPLLKDKIIAFMLPKIKAIAINLKSTLPENIEVEDLIQEGIIALLNLVDKYDPSRGATFYTFSLKRIKGSMYDYLRNLDWMPRNIRHLTKEVEKTSNLLEGELRRTPTEEELAKHLEISVEEVKTAFKEMNRRQLLNLDGYFSSTEEDAIEIFPSESLTPEEIYYKEEIKELLNDSIKNLKEREQILLSLYYVEELNFKEIGKVLGLTESRICQIHSSVLSKLKSSLKEEIEE